MNNEVLLAEEKLKLAQKNLDEGKFNNAIAYCKQALSLNPKNFEATLLLGKLYFSNMDDKAFECFDLLKKLRPSSAEEYFYKGKAILYRGNNYKKAIADFNKVLEFSSENKTAYKGLAIAYANLKNKKLALENFDKFVELSGEKNFYDLLGEIYYSVDKKS